MICKKKGQVDYNMNKDCKAKKAVIYARYSSGNQREESIDSQLRICHKFADDHGYRVIEEYTDSALSGRTDQRPAFQRMIHDSSKKEFETVLIYSHDRFSRNNYDTATYKSRLKKNGVKVLSVTMPLDDSPESGLMERIMEGFAQYYSENLSRSTKRGLEENALHCKCNGGPIPLGYKIVDGRFEIDPVGAEAVRLIYNEYASGTSKTEIVRKLNKKGFRTSRGNKFVNNSLRSILGNRQYIGYYIYDKHEIEHGMPQIIDNTLFEKVVEQLERDKLSRGHSAQSQEYLLNGKLFCGICGAPMIGESGTSKSGKKYFYYSCSHRKRAKNGVRCKKKAIRKEELEDYVISYIQKEILTDEMIDLITNEAMRQVKEESENKELLHSLELEYKEVDKQINNFINAIGQGIFTQGIQNKLNDLEERKIELEDKIISEKMKTPELTEKHFKTWLKSFKIGNIEDIEMKRQLIQSLINSVYVYDENAKNKGDYVRIALTINITSRPTKKLKCSTVCQMVGHSANCPNIFKQVASFETFYRRA